MWIFIEKYLLKLFNATIFIIQIQMVKKNGWEIHSHLGIRFHTDYFLDRTIFCIILPFLVASIFIV